MNSDRQDQLRPPVSGLERVVPVERVAPDNVALHQALTPERANGDRKLKWPDLNH